MGILPKWNFIRLHIHLSKNWSFLSCIELRKLYEDIWTLNKTWSNWSHTIFHLPNSAVFNLPEGKLLSYFNVVPNGHILDVPNAFLGLLYYSAIFIIESFIYHLPSIIEYMRYITFTFNTLAMSSSIYLAYKLIMLQELCILCWTTHLLNTLLLVHYGKRLLRGGHVKRKDKKEW